MSSRDILFWDETRYHINPVPFGCPLCPNHCENPSRGKQCYCEEYHNVTQEQWEKEHLKDYEKWRDAEEASIWEGDPYSGSRRCPICKSKVIVHKSTKTATEGKWSSDSSIKTKMFPQDNDRFLVLVNPGSCTLLRSELQYAF